MKLKYPEKESDYFAVWHRFQNLSETKKREADFVLELLEEKNISDCEISLVEEGRFVRIKCLKIRYSEEQLLFPLNESSEILEELKKQNKLYNLERWPTTDWFHPPYIINKVMDTVYIRLKKANPAEHSVVLEDLLPLIYTPEHISVMLLIRYKQIPQFAEYLPIIEESVKAYFYGLTSVSICGLLPVVEGLFSQVFRFYGTPPTVTGAELIGQTVDKAVEDYKNKFSYYGYSFVPSEYLDTSFLVKLDEYIWMLRVFQDFGKNHLFAKDQIYNGRTELNRPGILHGKYTNYQYSSNFLILWSILDMLCFIMTLNQNGVSMFVPSPTKETKIFEDSLQLNDLK